MEWLQRMQSLKRGAWVSLAKSRSIDCACAAAACTPVRTSSTAPAMRTCRPCTRHQSYH